MHWKALDKVDSNLYKGIAILLIVTHNFMHLFPAPQENEFNFHPDRFLSLLYLFINEPENIIRVSLSFFGHFGVQIFIFLSAYGLAKKYSSHNLTYWPFIWQRMLKIYPAFILAILIWAVLNGVYNYGLLGPIKVLYSNIDSLLLKLSLLSNFIPGESISPVGPWWFIPFIFQFYFAFPFLLYLYSKWGGSILLAISISSILLSLVLQGKIGGLNIYFTVLGYLPGFCLGIYLAKKDDAGIHMPTLMILSALFIYFLGNIYKVFWYASHISFLILLLALFSYLAPKIKANIRFRRIILFFGGISMPLFLVNGFLREPFFSWANEYNHWLLTIVLCLLSLIVSILVALVLLNIERYLMIKDSRENMLSMFRIINHILMSAFTRTK